MSTERYLELEQITMNAKAAGYDFWDTVCAYCIMNSGEAAQVYEWFKG